MLGGLSRAKKIILVLVAVVVAITSSGGTYVLLMLNSYDHKPITSDKEDLGITNDDKSTDITNIALFGVDSRDSTQIKGNSDSIMIISVDKLHNKIKVISIMRDSLVEVPGHGITKITEAYGLGGAVLAIKTLNQNYDLNITDYASVNFENMAHIIDSVGGIEVDITQAEVTNANGSIAEQAMVTGTTPDYIQQAGLQTLNGMQAVAYARIRYVDNPNGQFGDFGRTDRQRYIMEQLFKKAIAMPATQYPSFAKKLLPYVETSLTVGEILDLAGIMTRDISFEQTRVPLLEYVINGGYSYNGKSTVYYSLEFAAAVIDAFIYDDIAPETYLETHEPPANGWLGSGADGTTSSSSAGSSASSSSSSQTPSSSWTPPVSSSSQPEPSSSSEPSSEPSSSVSSEPSSEPSSESSSSSEASSSSSQTP